MAHLSYQPGRTRPDYCGIYHADVVAGTYAFGAIAAALVQRHGTQTGQHIDVSMLESMLSLTLNEVQWSQFDVASPSRPMFGPVETANGYVMLAIASEKTFQSLVRASGHPEWISDVRFAKYADRRGNWKDLMDGVETWSRTLSTGNCLAALNRCGVPASAYRTVAEALSDPQIAHRGALAEVEDGGGTFKVMNLPFRMAGASVTAGEGAGKPAGDTCAGLRPERCCDDIGQGPQKTRTARPRRAERRRPRPRSGSRAPAARIFRRTMPAHLHCARAGPQSGVHHLRRAGFGARRVHSRPNPQSVGRDEGALWADTAVHRP